MAKLDPTSDDRYSDIRGEYPHLAEVLTEVDTMFRKVSGRMRSVKKPATAQEQRLYLALIDKRVSLLTAAGLTPKAKRYLTGATVPAGSREDREADEEDDQFLDS